ncbi:MAG TPA: sulfite exporter TauE/SafE family protein [Phycisphaerales bacterium]|nr:sulfite exporter TauE/SafE family protein [Phycisphaerales bacterium]
MDPATLVGIGLAMGLFGGMLGIGGSLIMIPAMVFFYGENQHLYQSASMICNFCVAIASLLAHHKADALVPAVLWRMIPLAVLGILAGVALSNISFFSGRNSYLLARLFGGYLAAVAVYNALRLFRPPMPSINGSDPRAYQTPLLKIFSAGIGLITGLAAGLLGIGAGSVATPMQQFFLRLPLKRAMSNSASVIVGIAWIGAVYKTVTLPSHGIAMSESLIIAAYIIPTALIGGFLGGHLMHLMPRQIVRGFFIAVCVAGAWKLLTVAPAG